MRSTAPLSFDRGVDQVVAMMKRGTAFARVEETIEAAQLPDDHKAALWLLAWSHRDPAHQRQDALVTLALMP